MKTNSEFLNIIYFFDALKNKNLKEIVKLIAKYPNVVNSTYNNNHESSEFRALDFAIKEIKDDQIIKLLLENGADINKIDKDKNTPLHTYLEQKTKPDPEIVKLLINKNNINSENFLKFTPIHCAILQKNHEAVKLLIENGANVNKSSNSWFETPLKLAITKLDYDTIKLLIENGANLFDKEGNSYLDFYLKFTQNHDIEIVNLFETENNLNQKLNCYVNDSDHVNDSDQFNNKLIGADININP